MFCPTNISVSCEGPWGAHVSFAVIATNICPPPPPQPQPTVTYSQPPGSIFPVGTTLVCATSSIPGSVSRVCCFPVTVQGCCGTNCIQIVCPPDAVFPCSSSLGIGAYVDLSQPQFQPYLTNVCGGTIPTTLIVGCSPAPPPSGGPTYFPPGENTVICCVTNLQTGYIDCCCYKIFVLTNCVQPPPGQCQVVAVCPTNITVCVTNGAGTTNVPFLTPSLTNTCPQPVVITAQSWTTTPGAFFPLGKTTVGVCVKWVSVGAQGQSVGTNCCCYDVIVTCCPNPCDSTLKCPSDMVLPCPDPAGVPLNYYAFGTNPCYPQATLDCTPPSGTIIYGNTNVCCKLEYVSALGNLVVLTQCCFNVTVLCPTNCVPVITCPSNLYVTCPTLVAFRKGGLGTYVTYPPMTVTDSCGLAVSNWCNPPSGSFFKLNPPCTPVTCTAIDAAGNSAACAFQVCVLAPGCYVKNPSYELVQTNPLNSCTEPIDDAVGWSTVNTVGLHPGYTSAPALFQPPAAVPRNCWDYSYACNGSNYAGISGGYPLPAAYFTTDEMLGRLVAPLNNGKSYQLSTCLLLTTNTSPLSPWNPAPTSISVEFLLANSANPSNAANQFLIARTTVQSNNPTAWQHVRAPCFVVPPTNVWDALIVRISKFPPTITIGYVYVDNVNICCCPKIRLVGGPFPSLTYESFGSPATLQFSPDLTGIGNPITLGTSGNMDSAMGTLYLPMPFFSAFPLGFFKLAAPPPDTIDCGCYP